jgi:hypothetical protein
VRVGNKNPKALMTFFKECIRTPLMEWNLITNGSCRSSASVLRVKAE